MTLSCVTATGAMAAGSYVFTGTDVENIPLSDDIYNSTAGADPEVFGALIQNLQSFTYDGTMTLEANGTSSAMAAGVFANAIGTISVDGSISASAYAPLPTALGILPSAVGIFALDSGTVLNSAQITAYSDGNQAYSSGISMEDAGDLYNTGAISSTAISTYSANACGIQVRGRPIYTTLSGYQSEDVFALDRGTVLNSAQITAYSDGIWAHASGIYALLSGDLYNTGAISSTAIGSYYADARGIQVGGPFCNIVNSGSLDVYASTFATGISAEAAGDINNSGDITAISGYPSAGTTAIPAYQSVGIFAFDSGTVLNTAHITAYSDGTEAYATGIDTLDSGDLYNTGAITSMAIGTDYADARGIQVGSSSGSIVNSGSLDVFASSFAAGIYADTLAGSIDNSGDITATSGYQSVGIIASNSGTVFNSAQITAYSEGIVAYASGIFTQYSGDLYNTGAISSTAFGTDLADARGLQVGESSGNIVNFGSLDVFATTFATGIYADTLAGNIDNFADITVISENLAAGIYAFDTTGTVSNSGAIYASGANAFGIIASSSSDAVQSVVNHGFMNINAFDGAGIAIDSGCWDVSNPGFIYTSGNVRTLAVGSYDHLWTGSEPISPAYAHAMLVDDFRIIFDGDPNLEPEVEGAYVPQILVGNDGYLDLNGQTLIAQAGKNIAWNTPYQVIETYNYESELIANEFGDLVSPNPNINVSWVNSAEKGADAEVIFSYDPQVSMPAVGMRMANLGASYVSDLNQQRAFSGLLAQHIKKQQDILLADSGAIASDAGFLVTRSGDNLENAMFIRPYAKDIDRSTSGGIGYDGNLYGFVLGYERSLSPELTMGAHAGIGLGTIDFKGNGYAENGEDQTIYSLGLHAAYNPNAWLFDGSATFYVAEHEYDGKTGNFLEIDEDDDYTSSGAEMEAIVGNVIPFGNMAAMPYAGLGYSWINADSHTTDADDASWNTTYGSVDEHIARSILGTQLSSDLMWGEVKVVPTLGVRWAYALTDNNIKVKQSTLGSPNVAVEDDIDRSSIIGEASLGFSKGALNCELGGSTEYNDDYNTYGGWLALRAAF